MRQSDFTERLYEGYEINKKKAEDQGRPYSWEKHLKSRLRDDRDPSQYIREKNITTIDHLIADNAPEYIVQFVTDSNLLLNHMEKTKYFLLHNIIIGLLGLNQHDWAHVSTHIENLVKERTNLKEEDDRK